MIAPRLSDSNLPVEEGEEEQGLSSQVGKIDLERAMTKSGLVQDRKTHAQFILDLLLSVNKTFKARHPSMGTVDIEMASN